MLTDKIMEAMKDAFDELQRRPHQFVVAYYRLADDSLIGYHASTFCQITDDLLRGKRYANEDPYPQLKIIAENVKYALDTEHTGAFAGLHRNVQESFGGLKSNEIYLDAIYLAEGTEPQSFRYQIIQNDTNV